jgi:hypothetical protein
MAAKARRRSGEQRSIHRGAKHRHCEGVRRGSAGAGTVPQARDASQTLYRWKGKYGGMEVSEAKRMRGLEEENRQLKHAVAKLLFR